MCGIVGIVGQREAEWIHRMNGAIFHRGPDDQGVYESPDHLLTLAMRRLSIIDLAGGHQPMSSDDGTIWIVFNGEIFNAPDIRAELERQGHIFKTANSDTEVLLKLYEVKGQDLFKDLNGMFAFVIHDQRRQLLFGARDRMGIKPLYFWHEDGRFAFASELKSLLALPCIQRSVDCQSLFHYMTLLYVPDAASIIDTVQRLPPGNCFLYDLDKQQVNVRRYWQLSFPTVQNRSEGEWVESLRAELRAAVKRWTLSDVPIACSLSGGIDSSAIMGLLAEQGYASIKTYSLGFAGEKEEAWNELALASQVAQRWGSEHHEIILTPRELLDDLIAMVWHLDEPYGGGLPSWYVFREMSKSVKVGLTGTGGDELFGSYGRWRSYEEDPVLQMAVHFHQHFRSGASFLGAALGTVAPATERPPSSLPIVAHGRLQAKFTLLLRQPFGQYYYAISQFLSDQQKRDFVFQVNDDRFQDTSEYLQRLFDHTSAANIRDGLAAVDFRTQLAEEFLFMTDRFSMAHSLEARTPLLDHQLVEFVFTIPSSIRTRLRGLKYLFKKAVADLLPPDLLAAPKRGFVIPIELWLRHELRPLAERLLAPERLQKQGIFRPDFYHKYVQPHLGARANYTGPVWGALMFQLWHVIFIEENATSRPAFSWRDLC